MQDDGDARHRRLLRAKSVVSLVRRARAGRDRPERAPLVRSRFRSGLANQPSRKSPRYLRKFPFDKIKIDLTFIRGMSEEGESLAIVHAVAAVGRSLGIVTTAGSVETYEQFERLKAESQPAQACRRATGVARFICPPD